MELALAGVSDDVKAHALHADRVDDIPDLSRVVEHAFRFFRTHAEDHYSSRTMMDIVRACDRTIAATQVEGGGWDPDGIRSAVVIEEPFTFDAETERKTGGTIALGMLLPDNRAVLTVHRERRRQGWGGHALRLLPRTVHADATLPVVWVNQRNTAAQIFLLRGGLILNGQNNSGALRFTWATTQED